MHRNVFNTTFENSLRILLLLSIVNTATADRIAVYDFIAIYGKNFDVSEKNLHGDNDFELCEFATRRKYVLKALKELIIDNYISVKNTEIGFVYSINKNGLSIAMSLSTEYSVEYRLIIRMVVKKFECANEVSLIKIIDERTAFIMGG